MTLAQALGIINPRKGIGEKKTHFLACGFEALHLETFWRAHLLEALPETDVEIVKGVYGDLPGNLAKAGESAATAAAVAIEWSDLDPRLGLRAAGGWTAQVKADIPRSIPGRCAPIESAVEKLAGRMPVVVAPPSLPLPPIGNTIAAQWSGLELELENLAAGMMLRLAKMPGVRVANLGRMEPPVAPRQRLDAKMELLAGFPYTMAYASALAELLVKTLYQKAPKKGLITDLDDTFWSGIVGEVGVEGVSWLQESHTQAHGLYQHELGHLASCGALLGVCSKNEQTVVEAALGRPDLMLDAKTLFPVIANWGPKSKSVERVLRTWNINEDAVVFVDDSAMEIDEVQKAFPKMTCRQFYPKDPAKVWALTEELRDLFGKPALTEEDALRSQSIRASAELQEMGEGAVSPEFLKGLDGTVTLQWKVDGADKRPFELINKTNQFNLNGKRISEGDWQRCLEAPETVLAVESYQDKFGPLGRVAVLLGRKEGERVTVSSWVMSCRAFSRRLEHHLLERLFERAGVEEVEFDYQATERNQPLQEFFDAAGIAGEGGGTRRISRQAFEAAKGELPHRVVEG